MPKSPPRSSATLEITFLYTVVDVGTATHSLLVRNKVSARSRTASTYTVTAVEEDAGTQGTPTSSWKKDDIIAWIEANVETEGDLQACTKAELLELIEE